MRKRTESAPLGPDLAVGEPNVSFFRTIVHNAPTFGFEREGGDPDLGEFVGVLIVDDELRALWRSEGDGRAVRVSNGAYLVLLDSLGFVYAWPGEHSAVVAEFERFEASEMAVGE